MSNELSGVGPSGEVDYALIKNSAGQFWNGSAFEAFLDANYTTYAVTMTELGITGIYFGNFPSLITASGSYEFFVKRQQGGTPAEDDPISSTGKVDWTGTSAVSGGAAGSMSGSSWRDYVLRGGFKRTDKDAEIYEETTDAVNEMRGDFMFDEAEAEIATTDTITVLGDYKINVESDFGLLLGIVLEDGDNAVPLIQKSKAEFNNLYPYATSDPNFRGYPKHFAIYAGQIQIGPIPDRTSYVYRLSYSKRGGTITSSTTGVPFTANNRDVLRANVLARLYTLMDEFDKAAQFRAIYENWFESAKRTERNNSGVGNFNVKPFGM